MFTMTCGELFSSCKKLTFLYGTGANHTHLFESYIYDIT